MDFKTFYCLYGLSVLLSCAISFFVLMVLSLPSGVVIVDFNSFGELGFEMFLLLFAVPGFVLFVEEVVC